MRTPAAISSARPLSTAWRRRRRLPRELPSGSSTITTLASFSGQPTAPPPSRGSSRTAAATSSARRPAAALKRRRGVRSCLLPLATPSSSAPARSTTPMAATPNSVLTIDSSGDLFGTAVNGGAVWRRRVFEVAAGTSAITTLASFNGTNGINPPRRSWSWIAAATSSARP